MPGRACRWSLALGLLLTLIPARPQAQLLSAISISFTSVTGSVPLGGSGSDAATLNLGNVSMLQPLNGGVTRTVGASSYTVSTNFGVRTTKNLLGLLSAHYTLKARLQSAQPLTWRVDGINLSTTDTTIGTSQPYGTAVSHALALVVPFTQPAGTLTTVLEITAIAN